MDRIRKAWIGLSALAATGLQPAVALAAKKRKTGAVPEIEQTVSGVAIAVACVALVAVCVVAFKSAKRSHMD